MPTTTPNTRARSNKRDLTSPDTEFTADPKKNRSYSSVVMNSPISESADFCVGSDPVDTSRPDMDTASTSNNPSTLITNFTIPDEALLKISEMLVSTFQGQIENLVQKIVTGVTEHFNERI